MAKTYKTQVATLLKKAYETDKAYEGAYNEAVSEYEDVENELNEQTKAMEELHKMFILKQITHKVYTEEKAKVDKILEKLRDVGSRVHDINRYKLEDIREVYADIEAITSDFAKEVVDEQARIKEDLFKAKTNYLLSVIDLGQQYAEIFEIDSAIEDLKVMLGVKNYNYKSMDTFVGNIITNNYVGQKGIEISMEEITNVFKYKQLPKHLEKYVK